MRLACLQKKACVLTYASFSHKMRERLLENWAAQCIRDAGVSHGIVDATQSEKNKNDKQK